MAVLAHLRQRLGRLGAVAESGQQACIKASSSLLQRASEQVGALNKTGRTFGPHLQRALGDKVTRLQSFLDELNRSLAERALPRDRRDPVKKLSGPARLRTVSRRKKSLNKNI